MRPAAYPAWRYFRDQKHVLQSKLLKSDADYDELVKTVPDVFDAPTKVGEKVRQPGEKGDSAMIPGCQLHPNDGSTISVPLQPVSATPSDENDPSTWNEDELRGYLEGEGVSAKKLKGMSKAEMLSMITGK